MVAYRLFILFSISRSRYTNLEFIYVNKSKLFIFLGIIERKKTDPVSIITSGAQSEKQQIHISEFVL